MTSREETRRRPLMWIAVVVGALLLLPVVAIIVGFNLVPFMAMTSWAEGGWMLPAAVLLAIVVVIAFTSRDRTRA